MEPDPFPLSTLEADPTLNPPAGGSASKGVFTGADPGEGIDLSGSFVAAVDVGLTGASSWELRCGRTGSGRGGEKAERGGEEGNSRNSTTNVSKLSLSCSILITF